LTTGPRPQATTGRQADTQNYWGGSRYNTTTGGCTNGVTVRLGSVFEMMSAAHCGNNGDAANIPGQPTPTGTIFGKSACRDTMLIDYKNALQPRTYTGPFDSSSSVEFLGATPDFVGNLVVSGGASSGEHFNIPVQAVDVFIGPWAGTPCGSIGPLTRAGYSTATCAAAPGDSGGPVYSYVGPNVLARGTISASNLGTATCPGLVAGGGNTVWYAPLVRPAGDPQIGSLGFYGVTAPDPTIFNLNGSWTAGSGPRPVISMNGVAITVDMSAFHRPAAHGSVIDTSVITVTFPDDATYTGQLVAPNVIRWSNGSAWTKV
jgi:hypothetical protein